MFKKLLKLVDLFFALFPSKLPVGITEFENWLRSVLSIAGIPDTDKNRKTVANIVFSLPTTKAYVSRRKVASILIKAAANQVMAEVFRGPQGVKQDELVSKGYTGQTSSIGPIVNNGTTKENI